MYERNLFVSLVSPSGFGEDLVREEGGGGDCYGKLKQTLKKLKSIQPNNLFSFIFIQSHNWAIFLGGGGLIFYFHFIFTFWHLPSFKFLLEYF